MKKNTTTQRTVSPPSQGLGKAFTTYTVKSKTDGFIWVFKYHLNGDLESFRIVDGALSQKQARWFFMDGNFPFIEDLIKGWQVRLKDNFEVTIGYPDTSFEAFWNMYDHKTRKADTQVQWKKLTEAERVKAIQGHRGYRNFLQIESWRTKIDPNRYLKNKIYEDYI